jgi:hypothetical protein
MDRLTSKTSESLLGRLIVEILRNDEEKSLEESEFAREWNGISEWTDTKSHNGIDDYLFVSLLSTFRIPYSSELSHVMSCHGKSSLLNRSQSSVISISHHNGGENSLIYLKSCFESPSPIKSIKSLK